MPNPHKIIVVTAGGTIEKIDGVRGITNFSRGRLGHMTAERLAKSHTVYYVRSRTAPAPVDPSIVDMPVTDTASVWSALQEIREVTHVDVFIHAMAISDYTVDRVVDLDTLLTRILSLSETDLLTPAAVVELLTNPPAINGDGKVSSALQRPMLYLKPTEKILPKIKTLFPGVTLVGFKLLKGVSEDELLAVARTAMTTVNGDFVVANDLTQIHGEQHRAYILRSGSDYVMQAETKTDIVNVLDRIVKEQ